MTSRMKTLAYGAILTALMAAGSAQVLASGTMAIDAAGDFRTAWLRATPYQRTLIAEHIGERGAEALMRHEGFRPILLSTDKHVRQGFDQVWVGRGKVVVVEAKGGTAQLSAAYGQPQGSLQWAVKAAERTLNSPAASPAEKAAAARVIEAARKGNLEVRVVRTPHVLGRPQPPVLEQTAKASFGKKLAAAGISGVQFTGFYFVISTVADGYQVTRGNSNPNDFGAEVARNASKAAVAGTLYSVALVCLSNPGTATLVVLAAGSIIVVETGYAAMQPWIERETRAYSAFNSRLPSELRGASPPDRVCPSAQEGGFGLSYGPGAGHSYSGFLSRAIR